MNDHSDRSSHAHAVRPATRRARSAWVIFALWLGYTGMLMWQFESQAQLDRQTCRTVR